jgi:hypothetical protein
MNTGYAPHVEAILKQERDRSRDYLDDEIEVMATTYRYENGELKGVETKTIAESQFSMTRRQSGLFKFLGSFEK